MQIDTKNIEEKITQIDVAEVEKIKCGSVDYIIGEYTDEKNITAIIEFLNSFTFTKRYENIDCQRPPTEITIFYKNGTAERLVYQYTSLVYRGVSFAIGSSKTEELDSLLYSMDELEPVNRNEVAFTGIQERRILDITNAINTEQFITLKDLISNEGKMDMLQNAYNFAVVDYWLDESTPISFSYFEGGECMADPFILRPNNDIISVWNFKDTLIGRDYNIHYYPNGFDKTQARDDSFEPYINDYMDGYIYLTVYCDTGITDEQLMHQISYYYSLLIKK